MIEKNIGIIGLGTVGEKVVHLIEKNKEIIFNRSGVKIKIKGLCDKDKNKKKLAFHYGLNFTEDPFKLINDPDIEIIVELIGGINPAYHYLVSALKRNKHVVTANKALLAEKGEEIFRLASFLKKSIGFEASVGGGIPLIKSISEGLVGCKIKKFYGIINGTTNYILFRMQTKQIDFLEALKEATKEGFAEKDASLDIEGKDSLHKLCILCYLCFGVWPSLNELYCEGIKKISLLDIIYAYELKYIIKLLAIAKRKERFLDLRVHPALIPIEHPLSKVDFAYNALYLDTEPAGNFLFYGKGAGGEPTSVAVISDLISISLSTKKIFSRKENNFLFRDIKEIKLRYYIRFNALDKPGVLAGISRILANCGISIASVTQKERKIGRFVPIIMLTHEAKEENLRKALREIDKLPFIKAPSQWIRIEDL